MDDIVFRRITGSFSFHARGGDDDHGDRVVHVRTIHPPLERDMPNLNDLASPDFSAVLTLGDLGLGDLEPGEYAYLRIRQAHRGLAWTSPWFVR